jgi:4a-hydroxytetrahydrobiopterin dehydratase
MDLTSKKCIPCEMGGSPLEPNKIQEYLAHLGGGWEVADNPPATPEHSDGGRGKQIKKEWKFKDFTEAMAFVNKVAGVAEGDGHHPDIYIFYNRVRIELWTHAVGGLSENDFIVASKVDAIT